MLEASKRDPILPQIAYPEGLYAERATSYQLSAKILEFPTPVGKGRKIATSIDLHRTSRSMSDQDILDSVSNYVGTFMGKPGEPARNESEKAEHEKALVDMNIALTTAKSYMERVLGLKAPSVTVNSKQDIIDLIRKTQKYGAPERKGLETHAGNCALVSVALAVFELQKKESHTLTQEMRALEDFLTVSSDANAHAPLFHKHYPMEAPDHSATITMGGISPQCKARLWMRDKDSDSQITKYLMRPESTAEEALKDAIGIRLEVDNERIEDVLVSVSTYLQEHLNGSDLQIIEKGTFDGQRFKDFIARSSEEVPRGNRIKIVNDKNPLSADSFRVVKIFANIIIPGKDKMRSIEVQVVEPENKNERKLSSHAVYDLKKKITVMTRLFGGCSEAWLKSQLKDMSRTERYPEKIIEGLKDVGFMIALPGTKKVYGAISVYDRWLRVKGLIEDPAVRKQVVHGLGLKSDPLDETVKAKV